ncbi:MAG: hypothetical protein PHH71_03970, partial [Clostridia bacterium]|nr:hypothetical protein [Clostridia bacterium]
MKKKLTKIMFLIGFFLVSFFVSQNVFAETGDKGVIIESFEYNQNGELTLSWAVDDGYDTYFNNAFYAINGYYPSFRPEMIYLQSNYFRLEDASWGIIQFDFEFLDCQYIPNEDHPNYIVQKIDISEYGSKTCNVKVVSMSYVSPVGTYVKKSDIDSVYGLDFLENLTLDFYAFDLGVDYYYLGGGFSSGGTYVINEGYLEYPFTASTTFPILGTPVSVNGVCGSVNGSTFDWADFDNQDFCSSGDFYLSGDNGERIIYACEGLNGGTTQYNCSASYYYNGVCGSASNSSFSSLDISNTDLCSSGYVSESSFLESGSGWTWVCSGSGSSSFCNASKSLISFPEMPEETDCSSLTFPDNLLCNIENLLKTGFLPSASALNNLNNAVNQVQQKAPFNYLNVAI